MQHSVFGSLCGDKTFVFESLAVMIQKEQTIYNNISDYLGLVNAPKTIITADDRLAAVDWCYWIVDNHQLDHEIVESTMGLVDRFLSTSTEAARDSLFDRKKFMAVVAAALCVAVKMSHGISFCSKCFFPFCSAEDIGAMESSIVNKLSWQLNPPTSTQIAHHILSLLWPCVDVSEPTWGRAILEDVKLQLKYAARDYYFTLKRPSTTALAAILNAVNRVDKQVRQAFVLDAFLLIAKADFDSLEDLLVVKNRLVASLLGSSAVNIHAGAFKDTEEAKPTCFKELEAPFC